MKKVLSIILAAGMLLSVTVGIETAVNAADNEEGQVGDNVTYKIENNVLYIQGSGETWNYPSQTDKYGQQQRYPSWRDTVDKVVIDEGVTSIGNHLFENLMIAKEFYIPESVVKIGVASFYNLYRTVEIHFAGNTCEISDGDDTFVSYRTTTNDYFKGTFYCSKDSDAYEYALKHSFDYNIPESECPNAHANAQGKFNGASDYYCVQCGSYLYTDSDNPYTTNTTEPDNTNNPDPDENNNGNNANNPNENDNGNNTNYNSNTTTTTPTPSPTTSTTTPAPTQLQQTPATSANTTTTTTTATTTTQATTTSVKKPKSTSIKSLKKGKKQIKAAWKKVLGVKGYQVQVATDKKFKKNKKTVTIKKQKTTSATIKKLKSNKKYYVRVRTYKTVNGKKVYSSWSKVKTVKTK